MSEEEREELASLYALGLLEGDELKDFEQALARDPKLVALVAEFEEASNLLALSIPQRAAPPLTRLAIMRAIDAQQESVGHPEKARAAAYNWAPWALAAALAILCAITFAEKSRLGAAKARLEGDNRNLQARVTNLGVERDRLQTRITALEEEKTNLEIRVATFEAREPLKEIQNVALAPQQGAPTKSNLTALWDQGRQTGVLDLAGLPPPPPDRDYQLWIIPSATAAPLDAGILTSAVGARAIFQSPQEVTKIAAIAISLEPKGGSISPQGPVIYVGKM